MGRVGDGGGLRLEREKEKGKETGRLSTEGCPKDTEEEPMPTCSCRDRPAGVVATCDNFNTVSFHSPIIF